MFAGNKKMKNPHLIICCMEAIYCQTPVQSESKVQVQGTTPMDGHPPSKGWKFTNVLKFGTYT